MTTKDKAGRLLTQEEIAAAQARAEKTKHKKARDSSQGQISGNRIRVFCGGPSVVDGLGCGTASDFAPIASPAAPTLARAEELEREGWTHDGGSWHSMMLGISVLCPMCSKLAKSLK